MSSPIMTSYRYVYEVPVDEVDQAVYKVRALFSEDPLTFGKEGSFEDRFTTWFDLIQKADLRAFIAASIAMEADAKERQRVDSEDNAPAASHSMSETPLDPRNLAAINQRMQDVNVSDLLRQQTAVVVHSDGDGDVLFREHYSFDGEPPAPYRTEHQFIRQYMAVSIFNGVA